MLDTAQNKLDSQKIELLKYEGVRNNYEAAIDRAHMELAKKHSSTRIALATEGVGMGEGGWLDPS